MPLEETTMKTMAGQVCNTVVTPDEKLETREAMEFRLSQLRKEPTPSNYKRILALRKRLGMAGLVVKQAWPTKFQEEWELKAVAS